MKYLISTIAYHFNRNCPSCKLVNWLAVGLQSTKMNVTKCLNSILLLIICSSLAKSACPTDYIGDGYCDDENNFDECNYDGGNYIHVSLP